MHASFVARLTGRLIQGNMGLVICDGARHDPRCHQHGTDLAGGGLHPILTMQQESVTACIDEREGQGFRSCVAAFSAAATIPLARSNVTGWGPSWIP
jgi:hypothetical protein